MKGFYDQKALIFRMCFVTENFFFRKSFIHLVLCFLQHQQYPCKKTCYKTCFLVSLTWRMSVWLLTMIPAVALLSNLSPSRSHHTRCTWNQFETQLKQLDRQRSSVCKLGGDARQQMLPQDTGTVAADDCGINLFWICIKYKE